MKKLLFGIFLLTSIAGFCQDEEEEIEETEKPVATKEIGFDGYFGASNFGGSAGVGGKFGFRLNQYVVLGPSVRFQRSWTKNLTQESFGYSVYGGGVWIHARYANALFVGGEFEFLNSPNNIIYVSNQRRWVPTFFLGGGFSREFNSSVRLNAGIFYDVIDNGNSPFRSSYFMKKQNGALIPLIYRIGFFFPIG